MPVRFFLLCLALALPLRSENSGSTGQITGVVVQKGGGRPLPYVTVSVKDGNGRTVRTTATDAKGGFAFEKLELGAYDLTYAALGGEILATGQVTLDPSHLTRNVGKIEGSPAVTTLEQVNVSARRDAFYNSIDRKVYDVGKDVQSATGSASELLQNIPSVQVDVEGNVSLRGNGNVLILVDGKTSALMSTANRADVLQQMSADTIDKIEVITNPSAKYKPDGTAGIINIALKKQRAPGSSGAIRASVGNDSRYSLSFNGNYRPGKYNLFGTFSVRQDDRFRWSDEYRSHVDAATNALILTEQHTAEHMRPLSRLAQTGIDYDLDAKNKVGAKFDYNLRTFHRSSLITNLSRGSGGVVTTDYDRLRVDPEWQKTLRIAATYQHAFDDDGHELSFEAKRERHWEQEDNHYTNIFRAPAAPSSRDYGLTKPVELDTELTVGYVRPFAHDAKLEMGYSREIERFDMDYRNGFFESAANAFVPDLSRTNRFIYEDTIDALYATFGRPFGSFGFLAGLRLENTLVETNQVTTRVAGRRRYARAYPTLHLTYNLTDSQQLQLNYSHRIHRPETEDLNPFPLYQDPFNLRAGNPDLRPEDTHSIEAGYQYRKDDTTYLATVYFRETYHGFTTVTRYIDATTLLTTHENLANNRSGGIELAATRDIGPVSVNFSSNIYRNQIDASNLGYASSRSATAWDAKLNANWRANKSTLVQFNTNYRAKRLTAQGERRPTYIGNLGLRRELPDHKTAIVLTISDIFGTLKERTVIDTPTLHNDITRHSNSRIVYVGLIYSFGAAKKKGKDNGLQFDNSL